MQRTRGDSLHEEGKATAEHSPQQIVSTHLDASLTAEEGATTAILTEGAYEVPGGWVGQSGHCEGTEPASGQAMAVPSCLLP